MTDEEIRRAAERLLRSNLRRGRLSLRRAAVLLLPALARHLPLPVVLGLLLTQPSCWKASSGSTDYDEAISRRGAGTGWFWALEFADHLDGSPQPNPANTSVYRPPLTGDNFSAPIGVGQPPFSYGPIDVTDTLGVSVDTGEPFPCGGYGKSTLWFTFTPATDVVLTADTKGSDYWTALAVYTGSSLQSLGSEGCGTNYYGASVQFTARTGVTYFFQAGAYVLQGNSGTIDTRHLVFHLKATDGSTVQAVSSPTPSASPTPLPTSTPQATATPTASALPAPSPSPTAGPAPSPTPPPAARRRRFHLCSP